MSLTEILGVITVLILILAVLGIIQGIRRRRWGVVALTGIAAIALLTLLYWGLLTLITSM